MHAAASALAVALPALALGSFLNVVVARVPEGRSIVRPRSACGSCGATILWRDNIPCLSWLLLRGRCRHCGVRIPARYPLVEASTAALVVACVAAFGLTPYAALAAGFCAVLVAVTAIDADRRTIPDRIVLPSAAVVLCARTAIDPSPEWALSALAAGGAFTLAAFAAPRALRPDDAKLALLSGAMLGSALLVALPAGALAALAVVSARAASPRSRARTRLALAPFLAAGAVVALFLGDPLLASAGRL
jgi:leader peptidase (prepilin peptidase)/N-methyltransferase